MYLNIYYYYLWRYEIFVKHILTYWIPWTKYNPLKKRKILYTRENSSKYFLIKQNISTKYSQSHIFRKNLFRGKRHDRFQGEHYPLGVSFNGVINVPNIYIWAKMAYVFPVFPRHLIILISILFLWNCLNVYVWLRIYFL